MDVAIYQLGNREPLTQVFGALPGSPHWRITEQKDAWNCALRTALRAWYVRVMGGYGCGAIMTRTCELCYYSHLQSRAIRLEAS